MGGLICQSSCALDACRDPDNSGPCCCGGKGSSSCAHKDGSFAGIHKHDMEVQELLYSIEIDLCAETPTLGVRLARLDDKTKALVVTAIEDFGLVAKWNIDNPRGQVQVGDRIVGVRMGDVAGSIGALADGLKVKSYADDCLLRGRLTITLTKPHYVCAVNPFEESAAGPIALEHLLPKASTSASYCSRPALPAGNRRCRPTKNSRAIRTCSPPPSAPSIPAAGKSAVTKGGLFIVELRGAACTSHGLGLSVDHSNGKGTLLIKNVFKDGLVDSWNIANPTRQVGTGDRILQVNGVPGEASELVQACKNITQETIALTVQPCQSFAALHLANQADSQVIPLIPRVSVPLAIPRKSAPTWEVGSGGGVADPAATADCGAQRVCCAVRGRRSRGFGCFSAAAMSQPLMEPNIQDDAPPIWEIDNDDVTAATPGLTAQE